jgi:hypothetical protein
VLLVLFALSFDFFCDDAYITLRYAKNLVDHGAPVYNLGERVEGYTNFLWMLLAALGGALGFDLPNFVRGMGALSGLGIIVASRLLWRRLQPDRETLGVALLLAISSTAPIAAWTLGGLETPLFCALLTLGFALGASLAGGHLGAKLAVVVALTMASATLVRPEGALAFAVIFAVVAIARFRREGWLRHLVALGGVFTGIVGTHLAWRWSYYGNPLPNTFYAKTSGISAPLLAHGWDYAAFAVRDLGLALVAAAALALLLPVLRRANEAGAAYATRRALVWMTRLFTLPYLAYVISVGGDFLDLYRFFVPLMPLALAILLSAARDLCSALARGRRPPARRAIGAVGLAILIASLVLHHAHQRALATRARSFYDRDRLALGIEPIGWTRVQALRWGAFGRWVHAIADPNDWMAFGASGAAPYYSGINNLDTFGLNDAYVAHHGTIFSDRPGHLIFAPFDYILSKRPALILLGPKMSDEPQELTLEPDWESRGYVMGEAMIDAEAFGAPDTFYFSMLMRRDWTQKHRGSPFLRTTLD